MVGLGEKAPHSRIRNKNVKTPFGICYRKGYKLREIIGEGSTGDVWRAERIHSPDEIVAIKIVDTSKLEAKIKPVNRGEIELLKKLQGNQAIVKYIDDFRSNDYTFIVMEYCPNGDLRLLLDTKDPSFTTCPEVAAKQYFYRILYGVASLHSLGYCHRDLKMDNILIDANLNPKISDFGFAVCPGKDNEGNEVRCSTPCGSVNYSPPEILQRHDYKASQADVWSLGVILYAMLNGCYPFEKYGDHEAIIKELREGNLPFKDFVTPEARAFLAKILVKNPDQRPSVVDLMRDSWLSEVAVVQGVPELPIAGCFLPSQPNHDILNIEEERQKALRAHFKNSLEQPHDLQTITSRKTPVTHNINASTVIIGSSRGESVTLRSRVSHRNLAFAMGVAQNDLILHHRSTASLSHISSIKPGSNRKLRPNMPRTGPTHKYGNNPDSSFEPLKKLGIQGKEMPKESRYHPRHIKQTSSCFDETNLVDKKCSCLELSYPHPKQTSPPPTVAETASQCSISVEIGSPVQKSAVNNISPSIADITEHHDVEDTRPIGSYVVKTMALEAARVALEKAQLYRRSPPPPTVTPVPLFLEKTQQYRRLSPLSAVTPVPLPLHTVTPTLPDHLTKPPVTPIFRSFLPPITKDSLICSESSQTDFHQVQNKTSPTTPPTSPEKCISHKMMSYVPIMQRVESVASMKLPPVSGRSMRHAITIANINPASSFYMTPMPSKKQRMAQSRVNVIRTICESMKRK